MEIIIAVLALAVSVIALISNFTSNKYERNSFEDQIYQRFVQMWFEMDKVFIEHPEMHKYFYIDKVGNAYAELLSDNKNFELGICIAEMFCDVFQYSQPLEKYLTKDDKESYEDYKKMIMHSPIVRTSLDRYQWHESENNTGATVYARYNKKRQAKEIRPSHYGSNLERPYLGTMVRRRDVGTKAPANEPKGLFVCLY